MTTLTPREIVHELDKHIIGQDEAKRALAIALRNRWRRQQLPDDVRGEISPKNILMIGTDWSWEDRASTTISCLGRRPLYQS